jgi:hypothetical protein
MFLAGRETPHSRRGVFYLSYDMRSANFAKHPRDQTRCSRAKSKEFTDRQQGQKDERERILILFHDKVGPKLLVAVFAAQMAKEELKAKGLEESVTIAEIGNRLVEVIDCLVEILDPDDTVVEIQSDFMLGSVDKRLNVSNA